MNREENVIIISNISVEPFLQPIVEQYWIKQSDEIKFHYVPYRDCRDQRYHRYFKEAAYIIVWLNLEAFFPEIRHKEVGTKDELAELCGIETLCEKIAAYFSEGMTAKILWFSFENYSSPAATLYGYQRNSSVAGLNYRLHKILPENGVFIDLEQIIANVGIRNAYDTNNKYRWDYPYSKELTLAVVKELHKQYRIDHGVTPKCLVLDCDNVLWGGVLSEDGIENIKLGNCGWGKEYQDFQRFVLSLYNHGIILALCSKNDMNDVQQVFREHSGMILKEEQIACFQVNWRNKPENIKEIAEKLNINLDSLVFVDDSLIEIEAVKEMLPEVITIQYRRDEMYEYFSCFSLRNEVLGDEIIKRNETYKTDQYRQALREMCSTYDEYLNSLEIQLSIHNAVPAEYGRIAELTQRTSKCTNGVRCTVHDIKEWCSEENWHIYSVYLTDKFSDLGLVGILGIRGEELYIYSLSCRALGRGIEEKMCSYIQEHHLISSVKFNFTGKNMELESLLQNVFL